ncbi:unnamed protein product [Hyaloperonospora brassicae]|uniref:Uncharacterized protein n=1 Tax=Hyaloperonospora brassicae TaxID=162125 RepID=A0AAV0V1S5_HYABA|nr:unnamed protein product [Hyaloperonospora brassicae]
MEVIVLEDSSSSDESSEGTIERDSASGTLGDPSNLHQKYAQPAGYVNATGKEEKRYLRTNGAETAALKGQETV